MQGRDGRRSGTAPPGGVTVLAWPQPSPPRRQPDAPSPDGGPGRYDHAFDRALRGALSQSRGEATPSSPWSWPEISSHPPWRLELLARNHPRVSGRWLAGLLVDEVEQRLAGRAEERELQEAHELADLAVRLAAEDDDPAAEPDHELAARAWRARADSQRRAGELAAAEESLRRARRHLDRAAAEPLEEGLFHEARGRLLAARGHRHRAVLALRRAARLLRTIGQRHAEGRVRVFVGLLLARGPAPRPWQAQVELHEGLRRLDAAAAPELAATVRRCLARLSRKVPYPPLPGAARPGGRAASRFSAGSPAAAPPPAR